MSSKNIAQDLIAPCGMNCGICMAYLRKTNRCLGCRVMQNDTSVSRLRCKIKNCEVLQKRKAVFCFECDKFPCEVLKHLDKRYRTRYSMSMVDNLETIRDLGIEKFLGNEKTRWACPKCGGVICVHNKKCYACDK